jgi:hypothetical protein
MPMLLVQADDGSVIWRERVTAPDFETEHFRRCLAERVAWAVSDAERADVVDDPALLPLAAPLVA